MDFDRRTSDVDSSRRFTIFYASHEKDKLIPLGVEGGSGPVEASWCGCFNTLFRRFVGWTIEIHACPAQRAGCVPAYRRATAPRRRANMVVCLVGKKTYFQRDGIQPPPQSPGDWHSPAEAMVDAYAGGAEELVLRAVSAARGRRA
jgi:hypothetical protein